MSGWNFDECYLDGWSVATPLLCECPSVKSILCSYGVKWTGETSFCFASLWFSESTQQLLIARETDCYSWHDAEVVTLWWMRPSGGRSQKPRVLCLQKRIFQKSYSCSFCAVSSRPLGQAVSSAVKGAEQLLGLKTNGRCCFKTA
jgi:hypothetical protein